MATVIQEQQSRGDLRRNAVGNALGGIIEKGAEGYQNRADEMALQGAITKLGKDASPQDVLNAITGTHTYRQDAKQNFFKNYLGVKEFEKAQGTLAETRANNLKRQDQKDRELDIKEKNDKGSKKELEKVNNIKSGLQTVQEMRDIRKRGNIGRGSSITKNFSGDVAKDFGTYEQLGKTLIQMSTNIPIRNRLEFETLAEKLYDPTILDSEAEGTLDAMEKILTRSLIEDETKAATEAAKAESITPEGKIKVRNKETGKTGSIVPSEGWESKYERI